MKRSERLIKDPVHGYISVPRDFFCKFIDTPIFQRLRNIEQTSMRPLYPAAHHDRFIHFLGVYHLGCKIVRCLSAQRKERDLGFSDNEWARITKSFEIACLMHDCGHAPFSHTYEIYYNHSKTGIKRAESYLLKVVNNNDFKKDFDDVGVPPAPHESFSAYLVVSFFSDKIKDAGGDPILVARMITGIVNGQVSRVKRLEDIFINLLNGSPIDVDKLDYILRDTWASGVKNTSVDIERLLSAVMLLERDGKINLCYNKSCLSVLQSVVEAKNYLYEWIYNHHTVLYHKELMDRALKSVAAKLSEGEDEDFFWDCVFSPRPFLKSVQIREGLSIYLPTDGDIVCVMKMYAGEGGNRDVNELLSHSASRFALWKTFAEFKLLLKQYKIRDRDIRRMKNNALHVIQENFSIADSSDLVITDARISSAAIQPNEILINVGENLVSSTDVLKGKPATVKNFFYLFVPLKLKERKNDIIRVVMGDA